MTFYGFKNDIAKLIDYFASNNNEKDNNKNKNDLFISKDMTVIIHVITNNNNIEDMFYSLYAK